MPCTRNQQVLQVYPEDSDLHRYNHRIQQLSKPAGWMAEEHRTASYLHGKLLELRGEEDLIDLTSTEAVQNFCARLSELGGSDYTAKLVLEHPTNIDVIQIHMWCVNHELNDKAVEDES